MCRKIVIGNWLLGRAGIKCLYDGHHNIHNLPQLNTESFAIYACFFKGLYSLKCYIIHSPATNVYESLL